MKVAYEMERNSLNEAPTLFFNRWSPYLIS